MQLRTYIDTVRSGIGRAATLTGAGLLGTGLFLHDAILPGLITTTAAALGGTFLSPRLMTAHPKKKAIACTLYLSPPRARLPPRRRARRHRRHRALD